MTYRLKADNFYIQMTEISPDTPDTEKAATLAFRWKHVTLPLAFLFLSVILVAVFYTKLDAELAYRFSADGTPRGWVSRSVIVWGGLCLQVLFAAMAIGIAKVMTRLGSSMGQLNSAMNPQRMVILMSNMILLPQIIFSFIVLDVFIYNIYNCHLMPLWIFAVVVLVAGGMILVAFFSSSFNVMRKEYKDKKRSKQEE